MKLDLREKDGVSILVLSGQLTGGGGDEEFREAIDTLLASNRQQILVDFSEVTFMDSTGMGELVSGHRTVERFGGKLKLLNPSKRVHNSLTMTKLLPIFEIFENEDDAVKSFAENP
jgi:anti-sigma B factor antagonist